MKKVIVKQALGFSVCLYGIHLPKGAVYAILPECEKNGKHLHKTYIWVTDVKMARQQQHFYVWILSFNDKYPRRVYKDGTRGSARLLKDFINNLPESQLEITPVITHKDIEHVGGPRQRKGYNARYHTSLKEVQSGKGDRY